MSIMKHIRWPPPKRKVMSYVLLPATFLREIPHLREKTLRASMIARALAIFRIDHVIIYKDVNDEKWRDDAKLFKLLLEYFKTPPYLKRFLFKRLKELKYVGVAPPLKAPSHPEHALDFSSDFRLALILKKGKEILAEAGLPHVVKVKNKEKVHDKDLVILQIRQSEDDFVGEVVDSVPHYWDYDVSIENDLPSLIKKYHKLDNLIISTSRYGEDIRDIIEKLRVSLNKSSSVMIIFGSPKEGLKEIFNRFGLDINHDSDYVINFIPLQGVKTVRTEEALMSTLSIINLLTE